MENVIRLKVFENKSEVEELINLIKKSEIEILLTDRVGVRGGFAPPLSEIIISLGSAGVFTSLYKIICRYIEAGTKRKVTIRINDIEIIIDGHNILQEEELLKILKPYFKNDNDKKLTDKELNGLKTGESGQK